MASKGSSLDLDFVHPYQVAERLRERMAGKKCKWTTSKIIRVDPKDDTSEIVKIEIV